MSLQICLTPFQIVFCILFSQAVTLIVGYIPPFTLIHLCIKVHIDTTMQILIWDTERYLSGVHYLYVYLYFHGFGSLRFYNHSAWKLNSRVKYHVIITLKGTNVHRSIVRVVCIYLETIWKIRYICNLVLLIHFERFRSWKHRFYLKLNSLLNIWSSAGQIM